MRRGTGKSVRGFPLIDEEYADMPVVDIYFSSFGEVKCLVTAKCAALLGEISHSVTSVLG